MRRYVVDLAIPTAELLRYYRGGANAVLAHDRYGRRVRFPALALRRFVDARGVHGRFALEVDDDHRLVAITPLTLNTRGKTSRGRHERVESRRMYAAARALLFALDPEVSHELALESLAAYGCLPGAIVPLAGSPRQLLGLEFANPVGLAAGLDKDARAVEGLARLGFAFVEVGTVTPRPQGGNPKPRLFRLPPQHALINRMGFNNAGADAMVRRLGRLRERDRLGRTVLGVNVGKNKDTPLEAAAGDYCHCMAAVYPFADYLTLNLSSPNTPGLRTLQSEQSLVPLLDTVLTERARLAALHRRQVPVLLKVAPDLAGADVEIIAAAVQRSGIDGVIATNTTITRPGLDGVRHGAESGGLSGAPLHPLALDTVAALRRWLDPAVPVVGVGGIMDAAGGKSMLSRGADLLQVYTGFIYRGPALIRELAALAP